MRKSVFSVSRALAVSGLVASISLLSLSCGSDSASNCGIPPNLAGSWDGTLIDGTAGPGAIGFTFTQAACSLGGSWVTNFTSNPGSNNSGSLTGDADGTTVTLQLKSGDSTCALSVSGVLETSTSIRGTYTAVDCSVSSGGTFAIAQASPTP